MPLNICFDIENYLKGANDIRVCNFFLRCLCMRDMAIKNIDYYNDIRSCERAIIRAFDSTNIGGQNRDNLCKEIEAVTEEEILPLDEFGWTKSDERVASWICAYLLHTPTISNQMIIGSDSIYCPSMSSGSPQQYHSEYIYLGFHNVLDAYNKRFEHIIRFSDHLNDTSHTPDKNYIVLCPLLKKQMIINFKNRWGLMYQKSLSVKWLSGQEDVVSWAQDFVKEYPSNHHLTVWEPNTTYNFVQNTTPLSHAEELLAVRAMFDPWEDDDNSKKLLLMSLSKAWNQKELRETCVDKEALNTYLGIKIKIQLDELVEHYDARIGDILEKLINQHYRGLFQEK